MARYNAQKCSELYRDDDERCHGAQADALATGVFLRLAQEYEAAFGRTALHQFIKTAIRDDDLKPSESHHRLLSLPWRDVFTTNWDTLLEKTRSHISERSYDVVHTVADLASAASPRIVKLHGSLPSYYPLIFTEEDYRTYPRRYAPLVNTVQQAMMETVFILIGFSGDDPNSLHWSGWVRDNMGTSAPKIYLAGWLNLSPHRRQVLTERSVIQIDLAFHPRARDWPEQLREHYATDWVLHTLEAARPYDITEWPTPRDREQVRVPSLLEPVESPVSDQPTPEPVFRSSRETPVSIEEIRQLLRAWKHNRSKFPGWIIIPGDERERMSRETDGWAPDILRACSEFNAVERLEALRELIWRTGMLLDTVSAEVERVATETIAMIDCHVQTVDGGGQPGVRWSAVRVAWRAVALALITAARQRFDRECFDRMIAALLPFLDDDEDGRQQVCHERCLWALYSLDFETLQGLLDSWETEDCDPMWMLRKAAILVETQRRDEARRIVARALDQIRVASIDGYSLAGPSREGWALFMAAALEQRPGELSNDDVMSRHYRRWRELATSRCDALEEKQLCANAMAVREGNEQPQFDLDVRIGRVSSSRALRPERAALRAIRLTEVAALPPVAPPMRVSRDILETAAEALVYSQPRLAAHVVLRICNYDGEGVLDRVFSRARVAALPVHDVDALTESCLRCIEYALERMRRHDGGTWVERLRVTIEVLSRIVLRHQPDKVNAVLDGALSWYSNRYVARDPWLTRPIRNLLGRCWEALPENCRIDRVLDLLNAPIVGLDGFDTAGGGHPHADPGDVFLHRRPPLPARTPDNDERWQQAVSLLIRGLRAGGDPRVRASIRVGMPGMCDRLTDSEQAQVAAALWHSDFTGPDDLPRETNLHDWAFLQLPEPSTGLAEQRFHHKWLDKSILTRPIPRRSRHSYSIPYAPKPHDPNGVIYQIGLALTELKRIGHTLRISIEATKMIDNSSANGAP